MPVQNQDETFETFESIFFSFESVLSSDVTDPDKNFEKLISVPPSIKHPRVNKVFRWFNANKLSLNKDKTKYTFFHKAREKDNIPLKLPSLFINDREIKRIISIKYLGVLIDEHLTWKEHITLIEN